MLSLLRSRSFLPPRKAPPLKRKDYHPGGGRDTLQSLIVLWGEGAGGSVPRLNLFTFVFCKTTTNSACGICLVLSLQGLIRMDDLIQLTFKILMKFTYGRDITADELQELLDLRALVESLIGDTFSNPFVKFPLYKYMPTSTNRKLAQFEKRWLQFNKR